MGYFVGTVLKTKISPILALLRVHEGRDQGSGGVRQGELLPAMLAVQHVVRHGHLRRHEVW